MLLKSTLLSLLIIAATMLSGCIDEPEDANGGFNNTTPAIPLATATISTNGNSDDWLGIDPILTDPASDQNGNSSTDLISLSVAKDGTNMSMLMEVNGVMAFPHTPSQQYSHYEVGMHFFSDMYCNNEIGFVIVNNFTDQIGTNYHMVDDYISSGQVSTVTAPAGQFLETSFSLSSLGYSNYVTFNPYIQSFGAADIQHDETTEDSVCYSL